MRHLLALPLLLLLGCGSDPPERPEPTPTPAEEPTPEPKASASPNPTPTSSAATRTAPRPIGSPKPRSTKRPARKPFVEPKPRPFANGQPSWRQEPWWELKRTGRHLRVVYRVGELYGVMPAARWGGSPTTIPPRPPDAWLDHRCKRCSVDANPAGTPPNDGPITLDDDLDEELSEADRAKVEADFRAAAESWPKEAKLEIAEDGWVTLTHTAKAHRSVQAWVRHELCPHRGRKPAKRKR